MESKTLFLLNWKRLEWSQKYGKINLCKVCPVGPIHDDMASQSRRKRSDVHSTRDEVKIRAVATGGILGYIPPKVSLP